MIAATNSDLRRLVEEVASATVCITGSTPFPYWYRRCASESRTSHAGNALRQQTRGSGGQAVPSVDDDVIALLQTYRWPGNVRELENVIERAVVLTTALTITREAMLIEPAAAPRSTADFIEAPSEGRMDRAARQSGRRSR